LPFS
jgi:hypothetical protein